jgi:hypothetical protein|eukprot:g2299.t1
MIHSQSLLDHNESTAKEAAERLKEEETQLYLLANKTFEKKSGTHSLDHIKRQWHKHPKAPSKFHGDMHRRVDRDLRKSKLAFQKQREGILRVRRNILTSKREEGDAKRKMIMAEARGLQEKEKRKFLRQRTLIVKTAAMKDWYAKQLALEEVAKLKQVHLKRLKVIIDRRDYQLRNAKLELLNALKASLERSQNNVSRKKRHYLVEKGWKRAELEQHYERVLEYEASLGDEKDADKDIMHLLHSNEGTDQFVRDEGMTSSAMLYLKGVLD